MNLPYTETLAEAKVQYLSFNRQYNHIGLLRLLVMGVVVCLAYWLIQSPTLIIGIGCLLSIIAFLYLVTKQKKVSVLRIIAKAKIHINEQEIAFLEHQTFFADNGKDFEEEQHPYAYDLDVLGERSLYQYINRTHTFLARKLLAKQLLHPENEQILSTQKAIQALSPDVEWRQNFMAYAQQITDSEAFHKRIHQWAEIPVKPLSKTTLGFITLSPIVLITSLLLGYVGNYEAFSVLAKLLVTVHLLIFFVFMGRISKEKLGFERTSTMLFAFKECIALVEARFLEKNKQASQQITQLSRLLDDLDSVANILVSIPLNIFTFYHLHRYESLLKWKAFHASEIPQWLVLVAETEVLCSFANFSYNHPEFVFPTLNKAYEIAFEGIGHPLIPSKERVVNDIVLNSETFVLLTGSNMSGKSTFLRSLGVNMLLTLVGLPVCACKAFVHPLPLLASMRLSDSLSDGKSYFFAEVKRIQQIVIRLQEERCFVLLDEVLRGTNSEDKQYGTIKLIEKLLSLKALGVLATHDIEVCRLAERYPKELKNKCFESEIRDGELSFDYKLREGICQNKNATFLMKKLGIIEY